MKTLTNTKKGILFFLSLIIIGAIFVVAYLIFYGNENQIYNDIILEYTSIYSSNKSAEKNLINILCFSGIAIISVWFVIFKKKSDYTIKESLLNNQTEKEILTILLVGFSLGILISGTYQSILITAILYMALLFWADSTLAIPGICVYIMGLYTYVALYRLYVFFGGLKQGSESTAILIALILAIIPLFFKNKKRALIRIGIIESVLIPFSLLIMLSNKYLYNNTVVIINVTAATAITIGIIILAFEFEALWKIKEKWNNADSIDKIITLGTCVSIMFFNRFNGTGAIMSTDMHHPFENIIGYSQIFELGRKPFEDYIPVSGMYSIVQGAIFDWFGDGGTFANYYPTENLFYLFVIIITLWLLRKQLNNIYVLIISLILYIQSYNRLVFMLPIMLLLIWPKLIEKKNSWLICWYISSLLQGLYYPLFGAATCVAFIPLAIYQIVTYIKSGDLKTDIRKKTFWIGWIICGGLTIACGNFLIGTLKHMLAMAGQSVLADGLSRFGQLCPSWFLSYISTENTFVRLSLYCIISFIVPIAFVWGVYLLSLYCANVKRIGTKHTANMRDFCVVISIAIMALVCYTYTTLRLDMNSLYARSTSVLYTGMVLLLVIACNHIKDGRIRLLIFACAVAIPASVNNYGVTSLNANNNNAGFLFEKRDSAKLNSYYVVPEGYTYFEGAPGEKIGTGFISTDLFTSISYAHSTIADNSNQSYIGKFPRFGFYYLFGLKGDGAMEIGPTVKSFSAASETIDIVQKQKSIIGTSFESDVNYYFYHWVLTSGEYYWDEAKNEFIPNDGKYTYDEVIKKNSQCNTFFQNMDMGNKSGSMGQSIDSLEEIFTETNVSYSFHGKTTGTVIEYEQPLYGNDADYLYLEFSGIGDNYVNTLYDTNQEYTEDGTSLHKLLMKKTYNSGMKVLVTWTDEFGEVRGIYSNMSKGKLLIPLGANSSWLLENHDSITISVLQDDTIIDTPEITDIRFLKLREIQ